MEREQLAWMAGMFNGDGCISLTLLDWKTRFNARVQVALSQTDMETLGQCEEYVTKIIGKTPYRTVNKAHGDGKSDIHHIRMNKMVDVTTFLSAIRPWLVGKKAKKADLVIKYIERRKTFDHLNSNDVKRNIRNDEVSMRIVQEFYKLNNAKVPQKITEALNDYLAREYGQAPGSAEYAQAA